MKTILIAGGSSAAGIATARALVGAGYRVVTVGSSAARIESAAKASGASPLSADLAEPAAVAELHQKILSDYGPIHGLIHLVGGWRGGGGLAEQNDADWGFLSHNVIETLRITSREFAPDLEQTAGLLAIVSSTSVAKPTAGNANYVAAKAAAEAWTLAIAQGFGKAAEAEQLGEAATTAGQAAAVILRVKSLLTDEMRAAQPERRFPGYTHVDELAARIRTLFEQPAEQLNASVIDLTAD
ncbi:SDR family oxidoreductase [Psychromicrobium lacuslunae]|uniref:Short-chain dehydrogenase n=1 Tax=Psychromicrobium lacuslunae TaxID=1618207 RepID=A0A0D4BXE8_9MICC|nr:SDR family oxidoreductase [Psychromicrobium lacuslunae]AJT40796.1 short-chain dehydrogenase [Psychromicrobium lacuslunae]